MPTGVDYKADCQLLITAALIDARHRASRDRLIGHTLYNLAKQNIPSSGRQKTRQRNKCRTGHQNAPMPSTRQQSEGSMQRTKDLQDRMEYYWMKLRASSFIKSAQKTYWQDYCSTLDNTSKIGKVWGIRATNEWRHVSKQHTDDYGEWAWSTTPTKPKPRLLV